MKRFLISFVAGIMICTVMLIGSAKAEENKTLGISLHQALEEIKEDFDYLEDDQTTDGFPIKIASTEFGDLVVELTGKPEDLQLITITLLQHVPINTPENKQHRILAYSVLYNIFIEESSDILAWYEENLEIGLSQEERMEKNTQVKDKEQYIRLIVVTTKNGSLVSVEITPEPHKQK